MIGCVVLSEIDWWFVAVTTTLVFLALLIFGLVGAELADQRGRNTLSGAVLGVLLGPVGWLMIAMIGRR